MARRVFIIDNDPLGLSSCLAIGNAATRSVTRGGISAVNIWVGYKDGPGRHDPHKEHIDELKSLLS